MIIIRSRSTGVDTEVDGRAASQSFTPALIDFPVQLKLRNSLVAPIVTWRSCKSPVPFAIGLIFSVGIGTTGFKQEHSIIFQRS